MHVEHIASRLRCETPSVSPLTPEETDGIRLAVLLEIQRQEAQSSLSLGGYLGLGLGVTAIICLVMILLPPAGGQAVEWNGYEKPVARFQPMVRPWLRLPAVVPDQAEFQAALSAPERAPF